METLSIVNYPERIMLVFCRAILTRQFESIDTILRLVRENLGHASPPLLRQSCDEYIWLSYLNSISVSDAEELVICMNDLEQLAMVRAQHSYGELDATENLGLSPIVQGMKAKRQEVTERLHSLSDALKWKNDELPTAEWIANKTQNSQMYKFLYAATSRFVHFSGMELLRRSWGSIEEVSIGSTRYRDYWGAFALYWGFHLFNATLVESGNTLGLSPEWMNSDDWIQAVDRVEKHGKVPIITGDEVALSFDLD